MRAGQFAPLAKRQAYKVKDTTHFVFNVALLSEHVYYVMLEESNHLPMLTPAVNIC